MMIMIMIKNLYSTRTIKYSKALHIKLQFKKIPKKLIITIIIIKKFHALRNLKSLKFYTKLKLKY